MHNFMDKLNRKCISTILLCNLLLVYAFPVSAADTEVVLNESTGNESSIEVKANIPSTYTVKLPKNIKMTGNIGSYQVLVAGDIAGDEILSVVPDTTFQLSQAGKGTKPAMVTQNKTSWAFNEFGTNTTGTISTTDLTAGTWTGNFQFEISLSQEEMAPGLYSYDDGTMLKSWDDLKADGTITVKNGILNTEVFYPDLEYESFININSDALNGVLVISDEIKQIGYLTSDSSDVNMSPNSTSDKYGLPFCNLLKAVVIPSTIQIINAGAFAYCANLEYVKLPDNITSIEEMSFYDCVKLGTVFYKNTTYTNAESLEKALLANNVLLGEDVFTNTLLEENNQTFPTLSWDELIEQQYLIITDGTLYSKAEMYSIYQVTENESANYIRGNIDIPTTVNVLNDGVFGLCNNLTSIRLPANITKIGNAAFNKCRRLRNIIIPDSVTDYGVNMFNECTELQHITLSKCAGGISRGMFYDCNNLQAIEIPDGYTYIDTMAFQNCYELETLNLPEGMKTIGYGAFRSCRKLKNIEFPNSLTEIDSDAFHSCRKLEIVDLSKTQLAGIDDKVFRDCTNLKSVILPDNLYRINSQAFYGCPNLTAVTYKGVTYTNKTALNAALDANNIKYIQDTTSENYPFYKTGLSD